MASFFAALVSGLLFGLGLTVSQMINPAKVIAFIGVLGDFDLSLAFVRVVILPCHRCSAVARSTPERSNLLGWWRLRS